MTKVLLEGKQALLLAEGCKIDLRMKEDKKRLDAIKEELDLKEAGTYRNEIGDTLVISTQEKKSEIDPKKLFTIMDKKGIKDKFWNVIKVQITELKKVVPESAIAKMHYSLDSIIKYSFKH